MSMTAEQFELACLKCTLRTLQLRPRDILLTEGRLPANENDPLLDVARPTWIGSEYRVGGVLLLAKNPAGGSAVHRLASHPLDTIFADALKRLRERQDIESYRSWRNVQLQVMIDERNGWRVWRNSALAVIKNLGVSEHAVAFGNLVPFRVEGNRPTASEKERGLNQDVSHVVTLLEPSLIVDMAGGVPASCQLYCGSAEILRFRRANGDRGITAAGQTDLTAIASWASSSQRNSGLQSMQAYPSATPGDPRTVRATPVRMSLYPTEQYRGSKPANLTQPNVASRFGPYKIGNLSAILNRVNKRYDPRWIFYDAMTKLSRYEDYYFKFGDEKVYPETYRSSARTAHTEMAWARKKGWIVDA
jgi:hypothetical protein